MWFSYRKSPLGTVVREHMATVLGVYSCREEAEKDLESLRDKLSAELKIIDIGDVEGYEKIARLDVDLAELAKDGEKYVLVAIWGSTEP